MKQKDILKRGFKVFVIILANILVIALLYNQSNAISRIGSQGDEVVQIQTKLQSLGYLDGSVDGIFGEKTRSAVTKFQKDNGLSSDGVAGKQTLSALGIEESQKPSGGYGGYSESDFNLLAKIISAESRGEPFEGQVAVGAVIINRIKHPSFPNTLSGVIYQPNAFSCLYDGGVNAPVADSAYKAAREAINGSDPSGGAIYYYNAEKSTSKWIFTREVITVIGNHRFAI